MLCHVEIILKETEYSDHVKAGKRNIMKLLLGFTFPSIIVCAPFCMFRVPKQDIQANSFSRTNIQNYTRSSRLAYHVCDVGVSLASSFFKLMKTRAGFQFLLNNMKSKFEIASFSPWNNAKNRPSILLHIYKSMTEGKNKTNFSNFPSWCC